MIFQISVTSLLSNRSANSFAAVLNDSSNYGERRMSLGLSVVVSVVYLLVLCVCVLCVWGLVGVFWAGVVRWCMWCVWC